MGFEPMVPLPVHVLSKHAESATLAPLRLVSINRVSVWYVWLAPSYFLIVLKAGRERISPKFLREKHLIMALFGPQGIRGVTTRITSQLVP